MISLFIMVCFGGLDLLFKGRIHACFVVLYGHKMPILIFLKNHILSSKWVT